MEKRLFIAVPVSDDVRLWAAGLIARLRRTGADYRWVAAENLHLTLRFYGSVPEDRIPDIEAAMRTAAQRPVFDISFSGLGAFASWENPRVVWVGVGDGIAQLCELAAALGPPEEGRPFSAHLTLGRMRSRLNLDRLVEAVGAEPRPGLRQKAAGIRLYESRHTPQCSVYRVLNEQLLQTRGY